MTTIYTYRWSNTPERASRKGQLCRIMARGARNTVLVEFGDGHRMTTSGNALRKPKAQ